MKLFFRFFIPALLLSSSVFSQNKNLDYYLDTGLKNSPLLKEYSNLIQSSALDSLKIKAGLKPQLSAESQLMYAPAYKNFGYDSAITNGGNYSGVVKATQPIINKKYRTGQLQSIGLQSQTVAVNSKIAEIDLRKAITTQYLTAYADYYQIQFNQTILELFRNEQGVLKRLVEKGVYLQTDYINLNVSIKSQEIAGKQAFIQYKNDLATLNLLCGVGDTSTVILENPGVILQNTFDINNSPLSMQFKIDSLRNVNSKLLISLNYRPQLDAFLDAGFNAIDPRDIYRHFGTSFGVNFKMPLYDGRVRKLEYGKILLTESTRIYQRDFYTSQYYQQLNQLKEQLRLTEDLIADTKSQIAEQEKLIELYKAEIDRGLVRLIDFLTVVNNYSMVKNNLTQEEMSRMQLITQMNYLK